MNTLQTFAAHWPADPPRAQLRASIRSAHSRNGVQLPDDVLDEIVDLACHAAVEARSAFLRILGSSRMTIGLTALGPAEALLRHDLGILQTATKEVGQQVGARIVETKLERKNHG